MNERVSRRRRCGWGFTLIELLVVVAIIAVLISILLPSLGKAKERARLVVCQTHMRGWGQGFIMYASDFNGSLPMDGGDADTGQPIGRWDDTWLWFNGVVAYTAGGNKSYDQLYKDAVANGGHLPRVAENSMFICPSAGDPGGMGGTGDDTTTYPGYYKTFGYYATAASTGGSFTEPRPMLLCYGMNSKLRQWDMGDGKYDNPDHRQEGDISNLNALRPASLVPLLAEKRIRVNEIPLNDTPNRTKSLAQSKVTSNRFAARHNKGGNIVFADGHVELLNNSKISHGPGAVSPYFNYPDLVIWHPGS